MEPVARVARGDLQLSLLRDTLLVTNLPAKLLAHTFLNQKAVGFGVTLEVNRSSTIRCLPVHSPGLAQCWPKDRLQKICASLRTLTFHVHGGYGNLCITNTNCIHVHPLDFSWPFIPPLLRFKVLMLKQGIKNVKIISNYVSSSPYPHCLGP